MLKMKKLIIILGIACISAGLKAQIPVRIGNMEIIIRKQDQDTTMQVKILDEPSLPPPVGGESRTTTRSNTYKYHYSSAFGGFGFILPDNSSDYYPILDGNSINLYIGNMHRYQLSRRFALLGTWQYSYYNYRFNKKINDVNFNDVNFNDVVVHNNTYREDGVQFNKQVYRSHNAAFGAYTRFYLGQPKRRSNDGVFIDLGIQGDWAFSRYYKLRMYSGRDEKYRVPEVFNPFTASGVARLGFNKTFSFFVRYRFTDAFSHENLDRDLPRLTIGVTFL